MLRHIKPARVVGQRSLATYLNVNPRVQAALDARKPVVALESTVITHGLPYPQNLQVAKSLEGIIRAEGAVPATIALLDGEVRVGLELDELSHIASPSTRAVKVSTRDIPTVLSEGVTGGTTVAATMRIAHWAGIRVFATGGIGGVHRGAESSFDVSADLVELGRTPVAVVCAGAKSILDIRKTLEVLETNGVNVIVLDDQPFFPGFFVSRTPFKAPFSTPSVAQVAKILQITDRLKLNHGTLIACPLGGDHTQDEKLIADAVETAIAEADGANVSNKELTPFLLKRVTELTGSASLRINVALLENNAKIAAEIAREYTAREDNACRHPTSRDSEAGKPRILCLGASILDFEVVSDVEPKNDGGSYVSQLHSRPGGVGRNHAEGLHRLGNHVDFITAVGSDSNADVLRQNGLYFATDETVIRSKNVATATYLSVNVQGNIRHGFSAIGPIVAEISPEKLESLRKFFATTDFIVLDGNLTPAAFTKACELADRYKKPVWFDPTDIAKVARIFEGKNFASITHFSPNLNEFRNYCEFLGADQLPDEAFTSAETLSLELEKRPSFVRKVFPPTMRVLLITLGPGGVVLLHRPNTHRPEVIEMRRISSPDFSDHPFVSASGAGDSFNTGFITAHLKGFGPQECLEAGRRAAKLSMESVETVPSTISLRSVLPEQGKREVASA